MIHAVLQSLSYLTVTRIRDQGVCVAGGIVSVEGQLRRLFGSGDRTQSPGMSTTGPDRARRDVTAHQCPDIQ
jgi:hypothetical protein